MRVQHSLPSPQDSKLTKSEILILLYLSSFRFLTISLFMHLLNQKSPSYVRELLTHLYSLNLIQVINSREVKDNHTAAIYCLTKYSKEPLIKEGLRSDQQMRFVYKDMLRSKRFRNRQMQLCEVFLMIKEQALKAQRDINYYSRTDLFGYSALPDSKPDAMITINDNMKSKKNYLFYLLEPGISFNVHYSIINSLVDFYNESTVFPICILVCKEHRVMDKIRRYTYAKTREMEIDLPITFVLQIHEITFH